MSAWMTHEEALAHATEEAKATGWRHRVRKSRAVVGWWNASLIWPPIILASRVPSRVQARDEPCADPARCDIHGPSRE